MSAFIEKITDAVRKNILNDVLRANLNTNGEIFWVLEDSDTDFNKIQQRYPGNVFTTVEGAYAACTTNRNDVILMSANTAHALAAMMTVSKSRVHFIGMDSMSSGYRVTGLRTRIEMGVTTATTDIAMVKVTGNGCTFENIKFYSINTLAQHLYGVISAGESVVWKNCCFEMNNKLTTASMAEVLEQGTNSIFIRCSMAGDGYVVGTNARPNLLFDASVGNSSVGDGTEFKECRFVRWTSVAANPHVKIAAAADVTNYAIFDNCIFVAKIAEGAVAITDAFIQGASLTGGTVLIKDCATLSVTNIYTPGGKTGIFSNSPASNAAGGKVTQVS